MDYLSGTFSYVGEQPKKQTMKRILFLLAIMLSATQGSTQISSFGMGVGYINDTRIKQKSISSDFVIVDGIIVPIHHYDETKVSSNGGAITFHGNVCFIGWLIDNFQAKKETGVYSGYIGANKGFYISDYIGTSIALGGYHMKSGQTKKTDILLAADFNLGFQTGYKTNVFPKPLYLDFRWYLSGTVNSIRAEKFSALGSVYDDLLHFGFTGRYGSWVSRTDFGYKHLKKKYTDWNLNAKSFKSGIYYIIPDKSISHSFCIGVRYEGQYNYNFGQFTNTLNGRTHAICFEVSFLKL
jgi:hypothetical protein